MRCWLLHSESRRSWKTRLYAAHRIQMTSRQAQAFSTSYVRMIAVAHTFVGSVFVPMKPHEPSRCSSCAMGQLVLLSSRHSPMSRLPSTKLRLDLFYHSDFVRFARVQSSLGPTGYMLACSSFLVEALWYIPRPFQVALLHPRLFWLLFVMLMYSDDPHLLLILLECFG